MRIEIDRDLPTVPTDYSWQFGLGNDHAYLLHRTDICEHIKLAHDELGIRYIRFHGIFDDDMLTYQRMTDYSAYRFMPYAERIEEVNFRQIGHIFDNLLACRVKPFVEISFMPSALASGKKTGIRYNNNITMPKSLEKWAIFIQKFIRFLVDRYGAEEVEGWYFEVWNEPDLPIFFRGSQMDYFRLYEATARAVKSVDEKLRVGGPSSSACKWIPEFLSFCNANDVPCDFVSTHHYPGDAFGNSFTAKNALELIKEVRNCAKKRIPLSETIQRMFFHPETFKRWLKGALTKMDDAACKEVGDMPLFITEWNSMAVFGSPIHDEKYSAAFVIKTCLDLNHSAEAYMFWCCSDLFEEQFMLPKPFVGSYGIISNDGIPKPNFWAFKMLSQLYPQRLQLPMRTNKSVEYAAFSDGRRFQVLVYAQSMDNFEDQQHDVELQINMSARTISAQRIDNENCNPKKMWQELDSPNNLTKQQVDEIKEKTRLQTESLSYEVNKDSTLVRFSLRTNDVVLLTIE
jgi:xylan 1,4-beta-xylosidase